MNKKSDPSGQQSERNLVNLVKKYAPFEINLNDNTYKILDAEQLGGGNPEPKADVAIITNKGKLGISMKKPNFGFFESWMNAKKTLDMLISVGFDKKEAAEIVDVLKDEAKKKSNSQDFKKEVLNEYNTMIELIGNSHPAIKKIKNNQKFLISNFSMDSVNKSDIEKKLLKDKNHRFGRNKISSSFNVENLYLPLNKLLGNNYKKFLKIVIGGGQTNPFKADFVIQATIQTNLKEEQLIKILESSKSINQVVDEYSSDDDINLKFRLRPITATRAAYSGTNAGKYKKGAEFYANEDIGVSWTVHVAK